jgi:hypothetical protein
MCCRLLFMCCDSVALLMIPGGREQHNRQAGEFGPTAVPSRSASGTTWRRSAERPCRLVLVLTSRVALP